MKKSRRKNASLLSRIAASMWVVSTLTGIITLGLTIALILHRAENEEQKHIHAEETNMIALGLLDLLDLNDISEVMQRLPATLQLERLNELIAVYSSNGELLFSNKSRHDVLGLTPHKMSYLNRGFYSIDRPGEQHYLAQLRSYTTSDGTVLFFEIATPRETFGVIFSQVAPLFALFFSFVLILCWLLARTITRRALRPLYEMSEELTQLPLEQLKAWKLLRDQAQPKEFRPIVQRVNDLLKRVQNGLVRSQRMSQFISHEIRTPLTIIQGEIETALMQPELDRTTLEATLRSSLEEVLKIGEIVKAVLKLAPSSGVAAYRPALVSLTEIIKEALKSFRARGGLRQIENKISETEDLIIFGDRDLITLLIDNLLRNIDRHTPREASAKLEIEQLPENSFRLRFVDNGGGLSTEQLSAANDANDPHIEQLGIGLNLCKEIAALHQFQLEFTNLSPGLQTDLIGKLA